MCPSIFVMLLTNFDFYQLMLGGFILLKICLSLYCSKVAKNAKNSLASLKRENPRLEPTLAIIQVKYVCALTGCERSPLVPCLSETSEAHHSENNFNPFFMKNIVCFIIRQSNRVKWFHQIVDCPSSYLKQSQQTSDWESFVKERISFISSSFC